MNRASGIRRLLEDEDVLSIREVTDRRIILMTHKFAVCELMRADEYKGFLEGYDVHIPGPLFFFNRLFSHEQGAGEGTILMTELVKELDAHRFAVINQVNPYGSLNMRQLIRFYERYGFVKIEESIMYRLPQR